MKRDADGRMERREEDTVNSTQHQHEMLKNFFVQNVMLHCQLEQLGGLEKQREKGRERERERTLENEDLQQHVTVAVRCHSLPLLCALPAALRSANHIFHTIVVFVCYGAGHKLIKRCSSMTNAKQYKCREPESIKNI